MSNVETLAGLRCPNCRGEKTVPLYQTGGMPVGDIPTWVECPTCHGSGALVAGLRQECEHLYFTEPMSCYLCSGRGWTLVPAAEVMGVLVRYEKVIALQEVSGKWYADAQIDGWDTPEEALAAAILQSL